MILKVKLAGGGSDQFNDAGYYYFNLNRIISINAEFGGGVGFFTDGKGYQSGGSSVAWVLNNNTWSSADTQKVLNAIYKTIQANPNGKVVELRLPTGMEIKSIEVFGTFEI